MKKLKLVLIALMFFISVPGWADTEEAVNVTITSTRTEVALDGNTPCSSYLFKARSGDFKWYKTQTSTHYFTFKEGDGLNINFVRERQPTTLFWAETDSGTAVIEVFVFNNN